eukprot:scaffold58805_cov25-Tisochrysis_lutea.AAC.1
MQRALAYMIHDEAQTQPTSRLARANEDVLEIERATLKNMAQEHGTLKPQAHEESARHARESRGIVAYGSSRKGYVARQLRLSSNTPLYTRLSCPEQDRGKECP